MFGYTTLAHKEETDKTDKHGEKAVRQLPAWLGNTPAGPPERSPEWGNVCAPVGEEDFKRRACTTSAQLGLTLLLFSWAPWGISEDHASSHYTVSYPPLYANKPLYCRAFFPHLNSVNTVSMRISHRSLGRHRRKTTIGGTYTLRVQTVRARGNNLFGG